MRSRLSRPAATLAGLAVSIGLATMPQAAGAAAARTAFASLPAQQGGRQSAAPASSVTRQDVGGPELGEPGTGGPTMPGGGPPAAGRARVGVRHRGRRHWPGARGEGRARAVPPASTLKVLTAITLLPLLNPDATVVASQQAATTEEYDVGLIAGHSYKVSDLFNALLLISANDAAVALTQATGSLAKGMALINAEAYDLQAYDVVAVQPNGLPANGQVTSAYDQALIARQALAEPAVPEIRLDGVGPVPGQAGPTLVPLVNQNTLLTQYPGGIGGKIGWTEAAEATYIGIARRNGAHAHR